MIVHEINDINSPLVTFLKKEFSTISDQKIIKNYHPDFSCTRGNFFNVLEEGRYKKGKGKYYVIEEDSKYICSAGWNEYSLDEEIALLLTRMYVNPKYRGQYIIGNNILPSMIQECISYKNLYITVNEYNKSIYNWFLRSSKGKRPVLFNDWPEIYKNFKPVGEKMIYHTMQYVVEYIK